MRRDAIDFTPLCNSATTVPQGQNDCKSLRSSEMGH
jgi:hypothetical protein